MQADQTLDEYVLRAELGRRVGVSDLGLTVLGDMAHDISVGPQDRNVIVVDHGGTRKRQTYIGDMISERQSIKHDASIIPAGSDSRFVFECENPMTRCVVLDFPTAAFETYAPEIWSDQFSAGELVPAAFVPNTGLAQISLLLSREAHPVGGRGRLFADSLMRLLLIGLAQTAWSRTVGALPGSSAADLRLKRAIDYIEVHYATDISLTDIGKAAGLSPTQLTAVFRRHVGKTPFAYVIDRRVRQAVHLLKFTNHTIANIAVLTGFADQQHLTRVFRARVGRTPKTIRRG